MKIFNMSLLSLISYIKTMIFGSDKPTTLTKITPVFETENISDIEEGNKFYKRLKERQAALDIHKIPLNCNLEKNDESIICGNITFDMNDYEECKIIENYVSFMNIINYFETPIAERDSNDIQQVIDELTLSMSSHTTIKIKDNDFINVSLKSK